MMMSSNASEKRKPSRPKETKNKPDAGTNGRPVGRPRKDASTLKTAPPKLPQKHNHSKKRTVSQKVLFFTKLPSYTHFVLTAMTGNVELEHVASPTILDELVQPTEKGKCFWHFWHVL